MSDAKNAAAAAEEYAVEVNDVTMIFNMASEQLNNLKEYFIKLAKHELFFKEFRALKHISFKVRRGDVVGLVGTNGSGKSTMLKVIAGVLETSEGECIVRGNIAPLIELGAGFDMELTARENIYLNGALLGYTKQFIDEHLDEIVDFAELHDFMDMPLKNYSSGMVARIAFAIATITSRHLDCRRNPLRWRRLFPAKMRGANPALHRIGRRHGIVCLALHRTGRAHLQARRLDRKG